MKIFVRRMWMLVLSVAVATACSDSVAPEESDQMAVVPVQLNTAPSLSTLVVEVTAADIAPALVFNIELSGGSASDTLTIPAGSDRTFTVRGYDAKSIETHRGSATVDLVEGTNSPLTVVLDALVGNAPVTIVLGQIILDVSTPVDSLQVGQTAQLAAIVTTENGDTLDVVVEWATTRPAVLAVDSLGVVSGIASGTAEIVATVQGVAGSVSIVVPSTAGSWQLLAAENTGPPVDTITSQIRRLWTYAPDQDALFFVRNLGDSEPTELWKFDLSTNAWSLIPTSNAPSGSFRQFVYDPTQQEIVTWWAGVGNVYAVSTAGGAWTARATPGNDGTHYNGSQVIDPVTGNLYHFFGYGFSTFRNTALQLSGSTWQQMTTQGYAPLARRSGWGHGAQVRNGRVLLSGYQTSGGEIFDDLIAFDLATQTYTQVMPVDSSAGARIGAFPVFVDGLDGGVYRYGGWDVTLYPDSLYSSLQVLRFDGSAYYWDHVAVGGTQSPGQRGPAYTFYDESRGRLIVAGGSVQPTDPTGSGYWSREIWALKVR